MKVLKFMLSGKTAFFKREDVNTHFYFTYGHIHKVALLGMFGAILGYGGYSQVNKNDVYPEFYERLKDISIGIVPKVGNGYIPKKMQSFNNSVGYASKEQGGNLIVKEQWLENPAWEIYVLVDNEEAKRLAVFMKNKQSIYIPYLGKNDHLADITEVEVIENVYIQENISQINSFVKKEAITLDLDDDEGDANPFKYEEFLPIALDEKTYQYRKECFLYSNMAITSSTCEVVSVNDQNIVFY
jgi:CRISPR-associated protein Cas5, subtype I-B/HMARI